MTSDDGRRASGRPAAWPPTETASIATTGNYVPTRQPRATHGDSEQVTRVTGMGTKADYFYPTTWVAMDRADADFGSVNPMVITVPGATPSKLVVAIAKDGKGYMLDAAQLRGTTSGTAAGGQKAMFTLANDMAVFGAPRVLPDRDGNVRRHHGEHGAAGCPGGGTGRQVVAVRIAANPLSATVAWCAPMSGGRPARSPRPPTGRPTRSSGTRPTASSGAWTATPAP